MTNNMNYKKVTSLAVILFFLGLTGLRAQTVTDIDSNEYNTVTIGTQVWITENLKTTHYADGTAIPLVIFWNNWGPLEYTDKAYCWYDDDSATNANTYGALYTWSAAMNGATSSSSSPSGIQGVCPTGWHLPSDDEWTTLTDYLGGTDVAGGKLKDTAYWQSPNTGATNESGFAASPGGSRSYDGYFGWISYYGNWWSATEGNTATAWSRGLTYNFSAVYRFDYDKTAGFSVRCVMNYNTSINYLKINANILYPNPATERLYLKNSNYANTTIMIFDLQGKQVLIKKMDSESIDISNLRNGIYMVKVVCAEKVLITKFIKE
jgi:uncharacterized protein (TIGR02145 family)